MLLASLHIEITFVDVSSSTDQTNNVVKFFSSLSSSSFAFFDSGYKYTYDRFNNQFRYIPTNGDIAGLMVRTEIDQFPWYSPAGQQRGVLNNAIKLAFNPNKAQRDSLYEARVKLYCKHYLALEPFFMEIKPD